VKNKNSTQKKRKKRENTTVLKSNIKIVEEAKNQDP
jgi:hypothetical protein